MAAKTKNANAEHQETLRQRRKKQGFKRIELWIKPKWEASIKAFVEAITGAQETPKKEENKNGKK